MVENRTKKIKRKKEIKTQLVGWILFEHRNVNFLSGCVVVRLIRIYSVSFIRGMIASSVDTLL